MVEELYEQFKTGNDAVLSKLFDMIELHDQKETDVNDCCSAPLSSMHACAC